MDQSTLNAVEGLNNEVDEVAAVKSSLQEMGPGINAKNPLSTKYSDGRSD